MKVLFAALLLCGWSSSFALTGAIQPEIPTVMDTDFVIEEGEEPVTVEAPWIQFDLTLNNSSTQILSLTSVKIEIVFSEGTHEGVVELEGLQIPAEESITIEGVYMQLPESTDGYSIRLVFEGTTADGTAASIPVEFRAE